MAIDYSSVKKKRVAFLFGHLHKGGMQKAVSNISCALPDNIEQYMVFFGTENPGFEYKGTMIDLHVPGDMRSSFFKKLINFWCRIKRLQNFIDDNKIETVVSFGEIANILNIFTKRKKTVLSVRSSLEESLTGMYGFIYKNLVALLYKSTPLITTVSEKLAEQLSLQYKVPKDRIQVIYNLYNIEKIKSLSQENPDPEIEKIMQNPTIINVGSLSYEKGQEHLIRAFALAKQTIPELQLVIIGRGELQEHLESIAKQLAILDSVHFLGFQNNPYQFLSKASVFVLTSRFEGFPNALVEAMICGLPVIATDCNTGPREILGDSQHGILLPNLTGDNFGKVEQEIAGWIIRLLGSEMNQKYAQKSVVRSSDFSHKIIIQKWLEVL